MDLDPADELFALLRLRTRRERSPVALLDCSDDLLRATYRATAEERTRAERWHLAWLRKGAPLDWAGES